MFSIICKPVGLSVRQKEILAEACAKCQAVVTGISKASVHAPWVEVDVRVGVIDHGANAAGGPLKPWPGTRLPRTAHIVIQHSAAGRLNDEVLGAILLHELFHCLGFGCAWTGGFIDTTGARPLYVKPFAVAEYRRLLSDAGRDDRVAGIPVDHHGPLGDKKFLHWSKDVFGLEMMTAKSEAALGPLSAMSIAALRDLGYEVNPKAAEHYALPAA